MITRRAFLKSGALALVSMGGVAPSFLGRTVWAAVQRSSVRRPILVTVFQRGAVDGLNMVVPFGERAYYASRPTIAVPAPQSGQSESAIDLDGTFGLHPRLAPLKPLYDAGQLAVLHAVGSPDNTRSHFDAQDYMETATPGVKSTQDGWLNRCLQCASHPGRTAFRGVALAQRLPRSLSGRADALAISDIAQFGIRGDRTGAGLQSSFEEAYADAADRLLQSTGREAFEAVKMLRAADPAQYAPAHGADYPPSPFGKAMRQIAQLIKADVGVEIAFAEVGGWDTHVNQGASVGQLAARLSDFARTLGAFARDLGDRMSDVLVLTMSEFGRAVAENGNRGTDHGHANAMFAFGGRVRGGKVYGSWPGLEREQLYESRDLAVTTDFRDVFGEIAARHLGIENLTPVFPGYSLSPARFRNCLA
jgi:uncharacterized protein (DUF1501 family)